MNYWIDMDAVLESLHREARAKVGLLSHQAARTLTGVTTAQALHDALGSRLVALYGPEHGFLGMAGAGEKTASMTHPTWKIPVYSLYGEFRKPTPEMLDGIDIMVVDLQDLGYRCYTYLATLRNMLQACSEHGTKVFLIDRPIPLCGVVDGPMLDPALSSFVAPMNVPMVYGMTPGEAARWIVQEEGLTCSLTVFPVKDWSSDMCEPWRNFMPPSPGIRSWDSAIAYPATVFTEAFPMLDCDRAGALAFRVLGAPWLDPQAVCDALQERHSEYEVLFSAHMYTPVAGPYAGQTLNGVLMHVDNPELYQPIKTSMHILDVLQDVYGRDRLWGDATARPDFFDKLYGTRAARECLLAESPDLETLFDTWDDAIAAFTHQAPHGLY